jgi:protein-disulfide isomerase
MTALLLRCATLAMFLLLTCGTAGAQQRDPSVQYGSELPLVGDEGQRLLNHSVKLIGPIDRLPGVVVAANPAGKTTLVEFYDLNCPYCRAASTDIADMVGVDPQLRLVLVPFPVLGIASISAGRVELAVAKLATAQQFYEFHRRIYAQRGVIDGGRALEVARGLGFDEAVLSALGDSNEVTKTMKAHVALGNSLGLAATPSFVIAGTAILGYPGRGELQQIVDAAGTCGKVQC